MGKGDCRWQENKPRHPLRNPAFETTIAAATVLSSGLPDVLS
jgi:hypothetical protein